MEREQIIEFLKDFSAEKSYVNAMWLEGADGIGRADEYSDIDFWFDTAADYRESFLFEALGALGELSPIDSRYDEIRAEIAQSNIHMENTSEYLTLDICVQSHETRGKEATCFVKDDIAELPLIIFDKIGLITFREYTPDKAEIKEIFRKNKNRLLQSARVSKYIKRNLYPEAYMKYTENIAEPLIKIARLIYTPRHYEYGLCHISDHLPPDIIEELEPFLKVSGFSDIEKMIIRSRQLLPKYEKAITDKYEL